jgi:hypothetical protein
MSDQQGWDELVDGRFGLFRPCIFAECSRWPADRRLRSAHSVLDNWDIVGVVDVMDEMEREDVPDEKKAD